jgi:hypothetical protein
MLRSIKCTLILIMTLLFCFPCFASENRLRVFDTDYFTINLPIHMRQLSSRELPPPDGKKNILYGFVESNKTKKKSILLEINLEKINNPQPIALKEISTYFRDSARNSKCRNHASELVETYIGGRKGYYFQISNEGCVVAIERYWMTINDGYFFTICLNKPVKGDDAVYGRIEKEIVRVKLK